MTGPHVSPVVALLTCGALACAVQASAHDGPPYPIISNQVAGAYRISVWTDPDTTDDGSPAGRFWVMVDPASASGEVQGNIRARVSIRPTDRPGRVESAWAAPVNDQPSRQYVVLLMDHEGPFAVHVEVESAAGRAALDAEVQATYDVRPPPLMLVLYLMPFLLAGLLWAKLLVRRRRARTHPAA